MKNALRTLLLLFCLVLLGAAGLLGRLEKAFDALTVYDYFKAKELFYKSIRKDSVAAAYGLSVIYSRDDNPFTQFDSAYKYIRIAESGWPDLDQKARLEYAALGVDSSSVFGRARTVDSLAYLRALTSGEPAGWDMFIKKYGDNRFRAKAIQNRNELAFALAERRNTSEAYGDFLEKYPNAAQAGMAQKLYYSSVYLEKTTSKSLDSYQFFIDSFPSNPYVPEAEEQIFKRATNGGKPLDYLAFIEAFPNNPFVNEAWRRIYAAEVKEVSAENIADFTLNYPDYPFMRELKQEFELAITRFYPVTDGDYWGFIDDRGEPAIDLKFEWVEKFSDGFAAVGIGEELTYINKEGKPITDKRFSDGFAFNNGYAIVERGEALGIINRIGEYVVEPQYDDIGENSEGLFYVEKDGTYGYVSETGEISIPLIYSDALDFHQGVAVVTNNEGRKALINKNGDTLTSFEFDWIESFASYSLPTRFRKSGAFGLLNRGGLVLTDTLYAAIGEFSEDLALAGNGEAYGFLNARGDTTVDFKYTFSARALTDSKFVNGHAKVFQDGKVGIIDSIGSKVFPAIFEDVGPMIGSLIPVKKRGKWGYSDRDVNLAIPYGYSFAANFRDSMAIAAADGRFGVIDTLGGTVVPMVYSSIEWMDTLLLAKDSLFGIISLSRDTLVPFEYGEVMRIDRHVVQLKRVDGAFDYYDLGQKRFLRREENIE